VTTFVGWTDAFVERSLRAAVALLDHVRLGWRAEVDPDRLRMHDPRACVLGQLFGSYLMGLTQLREVTVRDNFEPWLYEFAFDGSFPVESWLTELAQPTPGGPA
jgi:hypothetical protein